MSIAAPEGQCCWMDGCAAPGLGFGAEGCYHDGGCEHRAEGLADPKCCRNRPARTDEAATRGSALGPALGGFGPRNLPDRPQPELTGVHHVGWDSHAQRGTKPYADSDTTGSTW